MMIITKQLIIQNVTKYPRLTFNFLFFFFFLRSRQGWQASRLGSTLQIYKIVTARTVLLEADDTCDDTSKYK